MAEIIAYHGWGLDHSCWHRWVQRFSQRGHRVMAADQGYFGCSNTPTFSTASNRRYPRILILHSFGLHLCPLETIQQADRVALISSFLSFHPDAPRLRQRSERVVAKMGDRFSTHPEAVLNQFWENCCKPHNTIPTILPSQRTLQQERLQQDLARLNTVALSPTSPVITALKHIPTVSVIHGTADQIVPLSQGVTLADAVAAPLFTIADTGHALPFSHPDQCWTLAPFTLL